VWRFPPSRGCCGTTGPCRWSCAWACSWSPARAGGGCVGDGVAPCVRLALVGGVARPSSTPRYPPCPCWLCASRTPAACRPPGARQSTGRSRRPDTTIRAKGGGGGGGRAPTRVHVNSLCCRLTTSKLGTVCNRKWRRRYVAGMNSRFKLASK